MAAGRRPCLAVFARNELVHFTPDTSSPRQYAAVEGLLRSSGPSTLRLGTQTRSHQRETACAKRFAKAVRNRVKKMSVKEPWS